jgi:hypothetical protein
MLANFNKDSYKVNSHQNIYFVKNKKLRLGGIKKLYAVKQNKSKDIEQCTRTIAHRYI